MVATGCAHDAQPNPARAREILERLQRLSEPFGTRITIENGIRVVRL